MAELEVHFPDGLVGFKPLSEDKPLVIGKGGEADIQIDQPRIASEHCIIQWQQKAFWVHSAGKGRNVRLNGKIIRRGVLRPNDELTVAQYRFVVRAKPGEAIFDSMDFQFDADALEDVEQHGVAIDEQGKSKKPKASDQYYVPLYRSPLFLAISGTLLSLCVVGLVLFLWVRSSSAEKQYDAAMDDVSSGLYASAIRRFDQFLESFPEGELAEQAVVWRGIARVRQFTEGSAGDWENAFNAAQQLYDEASEYPFYRQRGKDVYELMHKIGLGLAEKAKTTADPQLKTLAQEAVKFTERYVPAENFSPEGIAAIQAAIAEAEFVISKDQYRTQMLAEMEKSVTDLKPLDVYKYHQMLYGRYPELRGDEVAQSLRERARQLERSQIKFVSDVNIEEKPAGEVAPAWGLVKHTAEPTAKAAGALTAFQVQDTIYALDNGNGEVAWRYPTGFPTSFSPASVPGDATRMLVHCSKDNTLTLLDAKEGKPTWCRDLQDRQPVFGTEPLIRRGQIFLFVVKQDEPDLGRMLVLQLQSGAEVGEYIFPQPLIGAPILDSQRDSLLILGQWATVYDINLREQACQQVIPVDHESGAIRATPLLASRFLFLVENQGNGKSTLRCLVVSERDGSVRDRQQIPLSGEVLTAPAVAGGRIFITTDKDLLYVYELGGEADPKPLAPLFVPPDSREPPGFQPIVFPVDDQNCWTVSKTLRWIPLRLGQPITGPEWEGELPGLPSAHPVEYRKLLIVASNDTEAKAISVRAMDTQTRKIVWECQLGHQPEAIRSDPNSQTLQWFDRDGGRQLEEQEIASDKVVHIPIPGKKSDIDRRQYVTFRTLSEWNDGVVQWAGIGHNRLMYFPANGLGKEVVLPCVVSGKPAILNDGLLIPGMDGFLYWIDPRTGRELAEPFMGPYVEGSPSRLRSVTAVDPSKIILVADQQVLRLELKQTPFAHFQPTASTTLDRVAATQLVNLEDRIFMAHGAELVSLQPETLEILDRWSLKSHVDKPPVSIGKNVIFITQQNEMVCLGGTKGQISILWEWKLDSPVVGQPVAVEDGFWVALANGRLVKHALDEQRILHETTAGRALVDGPWQVGDRLATLAADGSVATVARPIREEATN